MNKKEHEMKTMAQLAQDCLDMWDFDVYVDADEAEGIVRLFLQENRLLIAEKDYERAYSQIEEYVLASGVSLKE